MSDSLDRQFKDTGGVIARFNGLSCYGHFDVADAAFFDQAQSVGAKYTFTYSACKLPGITNAATLNVDGTDYEVRQAPFRKSDGSSFVLLRDA